MSARGHRRSGSAPSSYDTRFTQVASNSPMFSTLDLTRLGVYPAPSSARGRPSARAGSSGGGHTPGQALLKPLDLPKVGKRQSSSALTKMAPVDMWNSPEKDAVLRGVAWAFHAHVASGEAPRSSMLQPASDRFSEALHPLEPHRPKKFKVPPPVEVYEFLKLLHRQLDIDLSVVIMCLIYVERVLELNAVQLHADTWRRMVLAGILEAAKVLYDELVWNVDLTEAFPDFSLGDINELEAEFCELLQFNFYVRASTYAKYYFAITALPNAHRRRSEPGGLDLHAGFEPLASSRAAVQDAVSEGAGARIEMRTLSVDVSRMPSSSRLEVPSARASPSPRTPPRHRGRRRQHSYP